MNDIDEIEADETLYLLFLEDAVRMPDGGLLCLCDRDPLSEEVAWETARAVALFTELNLSLGGCLHQAAAAYATIRNNLKREPAKRLHQTMHEAKQMIDAMERVNANEEQPFFTEMPTDGTTLN